MGAAALALVLLLPATLASYVFLLLIALAAYEWAAFCALRQPLHRAIFSLTVVSVAWVAFSCAGNQIFEHRVLMTAATWWVLAAFWIISIQVYGKPKLPAWLIGLLGGFVLVSAYVGVLVLLELRPALVVLFLAVWSADVFAYCGGRSSSNTSMPT